MRITGANLPRFRQGKEKGVFGSHLLIGPALCSSTQGQTLLNSRAWMIIEGRVVSGSDYKFLNAVDSKIQDLTQVLPP